MEFRCLAHCIFSCPGRLNLSQAWTSSMLSVKTFTVLLAAVAYGSVCAVPVSQNPAPASTSTTKSLFAVSASATRSPNDAKAYWGTKHATTPPMNAVSSCWHSDQHKKLMDLHSMRLCLWPMQSTQSPVGQECPVHPSGSITLPTELSVIESDAIMDLPLHSCKRNPQAGDQYVRLVRLSSLHLSIYLTILVFRVNFCR